MEPTRAYPESAPIAHAAQLWRFAPPSRLNAGMLLAVGLAIASWVWLFHARGGFQLRVIGRNRRAAAFFGIPVSLIGIATMALSGAMAGLGGAVQISAVSHRLYESFSPGWGYEAIAVALVARLDPIAVLPSALFFGALDNGSQAMQRAQGASPELVQVIQGMVILILLAFDTQAWPVAGGAPALIDPEIADAADAQAIAGSGGDA